MKLALTPVLAVALITGCATRIQLRPEFASRAEELPVEVEGGFAPLKHFRLGAYTVNEITFEQQAPACIELGTRLCTGEYGPWRRKANVAALNQPSRWIECVGPPHKLDDGKARWLEGTSYPMHCSIGDIARTFTMEIEQRAVVRKLEFDDTRAGDPEIAVAETPAGDDLHIMRMLPPRGVFYNPDMRGYYVRRGAVTLGAVETTPGHPHAWIARDTAPELRQSVMFALLTIFMVNLP